MPVGFLTFRYLIRGFQPHSDEDIHAPGMVTVIRREGAWNDIGCRVCTDARFDIPKEWDIPCITSRERAHIESRPASR